MTTPIPPKVALIKALPAGLALSLLIAASIGPAAQAAGAAQARPHAGKALAQTVCSACHQVEPNPEFAPTLDPPAPSFQAIADRPTTSLAGLKRFMAHTKWDEHTLPMTMPDLMLTLEEQDTLARYIISLRKTTKP